jgi:bla regulator protein blaR1
MTIPEFWNGNWAALVNHLWQSTAVVGAAWLLALALRKNHAQVRYWIWMSASIKFLVPFALLVSIGSHWARPGNLSYARSEIYYSMAQLSQPFTQSSLQNAASPAATHFAGAHDWFPLLLAGVWLGGVLAVLGSWCVRWWRLSRLVRAARPAEERELRALRNAETAGGIKRPIALRFSQESREPGIFGILHPVLVLPTRILKQLNDEHLKSILAHEVGHVRRHDNLTAAISMLTEAVFWFYPPVWWVGARAMEERERACDEEVLLLLEQPQIYAESILKVCELCLESPLACVAGVTGSDLKARIARIMTQRPGTRVSLAGKMLLSAAGMVAVAGPLCFGVLHAMQANMPLLHPTAGQERSFEVATIKPNNETHPGFNLSMNPEHFVAKHISVNDLISWAYYTKSDDQILGVPSWTRTEFFDIEAKAAEGDVEAINKMGQPERIAQSRLLVQSLLADRFGLKVSFRTQELPVYALVVAKGGSKIKEVEATPIPPGTQPGTQPPPGAHWSRIAKTGQYEYTASAWPMNLTADWLSRFDEVSGRLVVDETGLKGTYDFVLSGVSMRPAPDEPVTSLFTALQEQLGLKLEPQKAPVEVVVVDQVQRPTPN